MEIIENISGATAVYPRVALTVGSFDGVHLGHRRVLDELLRVAADNEGTPAVLTMRPHPREFFSPDHAPNLLTSETKKLRLLEEAGVEVVFFLEFTEAVANLDRYTFVDEVLRERCRAETVIVGHDFCFAKDARGDYAFLARVGPDRGFAVHQVPPLFVEGERVSSTFIRERILQGDLDKAETFLGRKYSVVGEVIPGRGIGADLGFPTANIEPHHSAVPAQGVYVAEAHVASGRFCAAVNIGIAPTIRQEDIVIEAHLLDFDQDILGSEIEIVFHKRMRSEKKFASHEELSRQIDADVAQVRAHFQQAP